MNKITRLHLLSASVALVGMTFRVDAAENAYWTFSPADQTIETASDYFAPGNWTGGKVGSGDGVLANFTGDFTGVHYIKLDRELTVNSWLGQQNDTGDTYDPLGANRVVLVSDDPVNLAFSGQGEFVKYLTVFADLYPVFNAGYNRFRSMALAGDVNPDYNYLVVTVGSIFHRLDWYAKSAGEVRGDFTIGNTLSLSYATYNVYAPQGSAVDVTGRWSQTNLSRYIRRVGDAHVISAGTTVTGRGIPEGTFVKRVFSDASVELSAAATETIDNNELVFAAFTPHVYQRMNEVRRNTNDSDGMLRLMKYRPEDELTVEVGLLRFTENDRILFETEEGFYPGRMIIHNAPGPLRENLFRARNCHLEFAARTDGGEFAGFPDATLRMETASAKTRLSVQAGVTAKIGGVSELVGTMVKDGPGTLSFPLTGSASACSGTVVVEAGVLELEAGSYVKNVAISNGATLKINGEFRPASVTCEKGARIAGDGVLVVDSVDSLPEGLSFADGASFRSVAGSGEVLYVPVPQKPDEVGDPAMWLDFSRVDKLVFQDEDAMTIRRVNDVRDGSQYMFVTNASSQYYPTVKTNRNGEPHHVYMYRHRPAAVDINETETLVWSRRITGIKDVFMVMVCGDGGSENGGQFLGDTKAEGDYFRVPDGGVEYNLIHRTYSPAANGSFWMNGLPSPISDGYPYYGIQSGNADWSPFLMEHVANGGTQADCFAFSTQSPLCNGNQRICECVIYTNVLTAVQRAAVTDYLMKKWVHCNANFQRSATGGSVARLPEGASVSVAAGETLWAAEAGEGSAPFAKYGKGTLYVDEFSNPDATLHVADGRMVVQSVALTSEAFADKGLYLHLDAENGASLETDGDGNVTEWRDRRPDAALGAAPLAGSSALPKLLKPAALGTLHTVDFGAFADGASAADKCAFAFPAVDTAHTVIGVYGTAAGGGPIVGGATSGRGILRGGSAGASVGDPLTTNATGAPDFRTKRAAAASLNGTALADVRSACFTGGYDLLSFTAYAGFGADGLAVAGAGRYTGGQALGEILVYTNGLSNFETSMVEAYLSKKWRGEAPDGFSTASVGKLEVDDDAVLQIVGTGPVETRTLAGSGEVDGFVSLAQDGVLEVVIREDGTIAPIRISEDLRVDGGLTVVLKGATDRLVAGSFTLVAASAICGLDPAQCTVVCEGRRARLAFEVTSDGGDLVLTAIKRGLAIIVR